ncbi:MAG: HAMP domain-containing sensor histidine kinase [Bacteroidota bacterium]
MGDSIAAEMIQDQKPEILDRWLAKVSDEIPKDNERSVPILNDSISGLLKVLTEGLDNTQTIVSESNHYVKDKIHITQYSVGQIVKECHLLRQSIFSVADEKDLYLSTQERNSITYAIDQMVEYFTMTFAPIYASKYQPPQPPEKPQGQIDELKARENLRDQFIATLSHDMRSPLGNIQHLAQLLEERLGSSDDIFVKKALRGITLNAEQGNDLITTLIDANLIQSGNPLPLRKKKNDLLREIHQLLESFKPTLRDRIILNSHQQQIMGYWDPQALKRAINNLISNAVKYGGRENVITLSLQQSDQNTTISVHNFGNPIPAEKIDRLFDLYYRNPGTKTRGWGLGLTLAKGVAEAHDGNIQARSNAAEGTTFILTIPNTDQ